MIGVLPHLLASLAALSFAFGIFQTSFVTSGLQFVTPALVVVVAHLVWVLAVQGRERGYAAIVLHRSAWSGVLMAVVFIALQILAPMPSEAQGMGEYVQGALVILFCLAVLIAIASAILGTLWLVYRLLAAIFGALFGRRGDGEDGPMRDGGTMVVVIALLGGLSLEGVPRSFSFESEIVSTSSHYVDASPDAVWQAMGTATSPEFPLPNILMGFPQPVAVSVDEGVEMGSNRVVRMEGREGAGDLHLRVVERTEEAVTFERLSHSSPIAQWVDIHQLSYSVVPEGTGTRLDVSLTFDRLLAPTWAFGPLMKGAGILSMGVLALDTAERAEAL